MESLQIIDKFCSGRPLTVFSNMTYEFMQVIGYAKQSFADFLLRKFHRKTPMFESLIKKVAGLKAWNFIKKRLQHRCFSEKFAKFLKTPFLQNTSGGCFWKWKDISSSFHFLFHDLAKCSVFN